jgi:predicted CoA-binding protein
VAIPQQILEKARTVLLVDWPSAAVPRALLEAGFHVFGFSPGGYSRAQLVAVPPAERDGVRSLPPERENETGHLVFQRLDRRPEQVDIVYVYRPVDEIPGILVTHAVPLSATAVWLQPPMRVADARWLAETGGPEIIEGCDIVEAVRDLRR